MTAASKPRYPGSTPFADSDLDRKLFCGRRKESQIVLHSILSHDLLVLFGISGSGKTSLLRAGVAPGLRSRDFWPVWVRLNDPSSSPLDAIWSALNQEDAHADVTVELHGENGPADLWDLLSRLEIWRGDLLQTPVLIFDQFEEVFTLLDDETRRMFLADFASVVRGVPPEGEDTRAIAGRRRAPPVKIVVSIREDFLGELDTLSTTVPQILGQRYRLRPLDRIQAEEAVEAPAKVEDSRLKSPAFKFSDDALEMIVEFLSEQRQKGHLGISDAVEASHLQIICQHVEDTIVLTKLGSASPSGTDAQSTEIVVTPADIGGVDGLIRIISDFYGRQLERFTGSRRRRIRALCETGLISSRQRRLSLEKDEIADHYGVSPTELSQLVEQRLLRAEPRVGSVYYELAHDALIEPILSYKQGIEARTRRRLIAIGAFVGLVAVSGLLLGTVMSSPPASLAEAVPEAMGIIADEAGRPLGGVEVEFFEVVEGLNSADPQRGPLVATAVSSASDGSYRSFLQAGVYRVRFSLDGYPETWWPANDNFATASDIAVGADRPVPRINATLEAEPGKITGVILAGARGAGTTITIERQGETAFERPQQQTERQFAFDGLPTPSTYILTFTKRGYEAKVLNVSLGPGEAQELQVALMATGEAGLDLTLVKQINGADADSPNGPDVPRLSPGDPMTLRFIVANNGGEPVNLSELQIVDSQVAGLRLIPEDDPNGDQVLSPGESWTFLTEVQAANLTLDTTDAVLGCDGRPTLATSAELVTNETVVSTDFAYYCNRLEGTVEGSVYEDRDGNGEASLEEPGIPSVQVQAAEVDSNRVLTATTDSSGRFEMSLPSGEYVIELVDSDLISSETTAQQITVFEGQTSTVAMGVIQLVHRITGVVFDDLDRDGIRAEDEPTISGVPVTIRGADVVGSVTTDASGVFAVEVADGEFELFANATEDHGLLGLQRIVLSGSNVNVDIPLTRYLIASCGSIVDGQTSLEWVVGPDVDTPYDDAVDWVATLSECGGDWQMPTVEDLQGLYIEGSAAGIGFLRPSDNRRYPAMIDPVFDEIGSGSWVWTDEEVSTSTAVAVNMYTNDSVNLDKDLGPPLAAPRAFAVRTFRPTS